MITIVFSFGSSIKLQRRDIKNLVENLLFLARNSSRSYVTDDKTLTKLMIEKKIQNK